MAKWEDIFWEIDNLLAKYPILDHWRYAWNKIFSSETIETSEGKKKYPKAIKYTIAGALAIVTFIISFALTFAGVCCLSILSFTKVGVALSLPGVIFLSLLASTIAGPLLSGLMIFFFREEYNREGDPSLTLIFLNSPSYRKYLLSSVGLYFIISFSAYLISFILSLPLLVIKIGLTFFSGSLYIIIFLTLWYYYSFFLSERVEELALSETEEEKEEEETIIISVSEGDKEKSVEGIGIELSKETEAVDLEKASREVSLLKDEVVKAISKTSRTGLEPLIYSLKKGTKVMLLQIREDSSSGFIKVLLSSLLALLSSLLFIAPFVFGFPFSAVSSYRVIRKGAEAQ